METDIATIRLLLALLAIPAAAGASWAGVKVGLNGARQNIARIESIVNRLDDKIDGHTERISRLEVELINLKEK